MKNVLVVQNKASHTNAGIYVAGGTGTLVNCTVADQYAGAGVTRAGGTVAMTNCIVWYNDRDVVGTVQAGYCNVGSTNFGGNNISAAPLLVAGYYLATNSPCVNAGSDTAANLGLTNRTTRTDGVGDTGMVDMGWHYPAGSVVDQRYVDIYVATNGSDSNSGTNELQTFSTVTKALSMAQDGSRIHVSAPWIPLPKSVETRKGALSLNEKSRIVFTDRTLAPLAPILSKEIAALTGKRLAVADKRPESGDIVLAIDKKLKGEAYEFEVGTQATVRGGNYAAVAAGTVTLLQGLDHDQGAVTGPGRTGPAFRYSLQALGQEQGAVTLPCVWIRDEPKAAYRGLLVDLARQWHSIENVRDLVVLCRLYKINTLQLHFSDDESFTFPSTAYPKLKTPNRCYTIEQLRDLEVFARDRGITILPELDVPGHAGIMVQQMPEAFGNNPPGGNAICPGREDVYKAMDTMIGEMTDIFRTTPYFHIGADEVNMAPWNNCKDCRAYMAANKIPDAMELYRHFIVRMNEIVKKHGKKMIVWEGFHKEGQTKIPLDVTVMVWESFYQIAPDLIEQGYPIINASWQPLYVVGGGRRMWSPEHIYGWNMYRWEHYWSESKACKTPIVVQPNNLVLGAQLCAWEQPENAELPLLRPRVPAMSERLWNTNAGRTFADFNQRFGICDKLLDKMIQGSR
jgi:hexosaminidase